MNIIHLMERNCDLLQNATISVRNNVIMLKLVSSNLKAPVSAEQSLTAWNVVKGNFAGNETSWRILKAEVIKAETAPDIYHRVLQLAKEETESCNFRITCVSETCIGKGQSMFHCTVGFAGIRKINRAVFHKLRRFPKYLHKIKKLCLRRLSDVME